MLARSGGRRRRKKVKMAEGGGQGWTGVGSTIIDRLFAVSVVFLLETEYRHLCDTSGAVVER